ncbi:MAG: PAS domain-containing protein, partial [Promethearchaeota archaeon]
MVTDLTDVEKAISTVFDKLEQGFLIMIKFKITFMNKKAEEILGYTYE